MTKIYQVALSLIPGVGNALAKVLISYCGSAEAVFKSRTSQLAKIPGIGSKTIQAIRVNQVLEKAEREIQHCEKKNISILSFTDEAYPHRLKQIYDAPVVLYYKGKANLNAQKVVSIVGTRNATAYGKKVVEEIVEGLEKHHALIVSGLAYGIDIHAHRSSLKCGLKTIGVLANGPDIIYPYNHTTTAQEMLDHGALVSEIKPGVKPEAHYFPARNRIIAGMADVTIVVEAATSGGALITANLANDYNREVFALPGNVHQMYSKGCNTLIKSHKAHLFTSIEDIEYIMNWDLPDGPSQPDRVTLDLSGLTENEQKLVQLLANYRAGMLLDEISWKSQTPINQLASLLLNLEFKGIIKSLPGKKYKLARI